MAAPSIVGDGTKFFINVLNDNTFQKLGVLTRTEGRFSWAVLDPRRHLMNIWEKDRADFKQAAIDRNASAITNGPFLRYNGGTKYTATAGYAASSLASTVGFGISALLSPKSMWGPISNMHSKVDALLQVAYFSTHASEGYIFGTAESIVEDDLSRPNASYFGRNQGRLFGDYVVARGDPPTINEVIGGLFQSVENYAAVDAGDTAQLGTWGKAPILSAPPDKMRIFEEAGLSEAVEIYEEAARSPGEEGVPIGEGVEATDLCDGLMIALFGGGSPEKYANMLAAVLVESAVRVDGNESILLGSGSVLLQGSGMPFYKEKYNKYGYEFKAG
ncbi:MAG: hypothetical protein GY720_14720 [bacterium]|nr:hypothetical protein [bacterium]